MVALKEDRVYMYIVSERLAETNLECHLLWVWLSEELLRSLSKLLDLQLYGCLLCWVTYPEWEGGREEESK